MRNHFTPGPWKVKTFAGGFSIVTDNNSPALACMSNTTVNIAMHEQSANALLISQAPTMLNCLKLAQLALLEIEAQEKSLSSNFLAAQKNITDALRLLRMGGVCNG